MPTIGKTRDMKPGGERENTYKYPSVTQADPFTIRSRRRCGTVLSIQTQHAHCLEEIYEYYKRLRECLRLEKNNVSTLHFNI